MLAFFKKFMHNTLNGSKGQTLKTQELKNMSNYSDNMVAEMMEIGAFTFESASAYADKYPALSTRSVVSKAKSLGLEYTPKVVAKGVVKIRKSDVVAEITSELNLTDGELDSLVNAKAETLAVLLSAIVR